MKKILTCLALVLILAGVSVRQVSATETNIAFNTFSADGILDPVNQFDWNAGSGGVYLSDGSQYVPGSTLTPGQQITFLYQSTLSAFNSSPGTGINTTGLNGAYQITIVASLTETVQTFLTDGATVANATFTTTGGTAKIYYDTAINANVTAGTGFEDGTKILEGSIQNGTNSSFTFFFNNSTGLGATDITAIINPTFLDTTFFLTSGTQLPFTDLHDIDFTGQLRFPNNGTGTDCFFCGGDNPFPDTASTAANDLLVDGTNQFTVPEPSSMLLFGSGLVGLSGLLRRKSKKAKKA